MDASSVGNVVLVPFPFSDLSTTKLRPALVLADAGLGDRVCVQITSNSFADNRAVRIDTLDFRVGSLDRVSYARPGKLFTAHEGIFRRSVAQLSEAKHIEIVAGVVALLRRRGAA
jgi:mRNA interferase MazF